MNPAKKLQEVADLLDRVRPTDPGLYAIYIQDHKICFSRDTGHTDKLPTLARLNSIDVNQGLMPKQWQRIQDRIAIFHKRGIL